jgi:hypothetical protein
VPGYVAKFYHDGVLAASVSGIEVHPTGATLIGFLCYLGTAGTTDTEIDVLKNGVVLDSIVIAASTRRAEVAVSEPFRAWHDELQVEITTPGDGAERLTVYGRFRA